LLPKKTASPSGCDCPFLPVPAHLIHRGRKEKRKRRGGRRKKEREITG